MFKELVEAATNANQTGTQESERYKTLIAWFETALILLGLVGILFLLPHSTGYDGQDRFNALSAMLTQGTIPDIKYSMVGPFFSIPFWYLGKLYQSPLWWISRYNLFVFSAGLLATYWLLKDRVARGLLRKFFLLLIVASMFSHHLMFYYGEVFTAIFVAVGCVAIVVGPELAGWCVIILGVVNTPATLLGLVLLDAKHMLETRRVRYALTVIVTVALIMLESWILRGSPLETGYANLHGFRTIMPYSGRPGFSNPFFFGLISLLFSFGKGIFFFAPGLLLPIRKTPAQASGSDKGGPVCNLHAVDKLSCRPAAGLLVLVGLAWRLVLGTALSAYSIDPSLLRARCAPAMARRLTAGKRRDYPGTLPLRLGRHRWRGLRRCSSTESLPGQPRLSGDAPVLLHARI